VGEEGAAGLVDAHCSDRARDLSAARGGGAGEGPLVKAGEPNEAEERRLSKAVTRLVARGLIAVRGEEVRESELLRHIAASGDLTPTEPPGPLVAARGCRGLIAAIGEEVSEVLLEIEASGDLTPASGDEVSEVELFLQKR